MTLRCKKLDEVDLSSSFLDSIDFVLTDCDGVLWLADEAIPNSPQTIQKLQDLGKTIIYVTNNSSKSRIEYLKKFEKLGFPVQLDNIFSTSYCIVIHLQSLNFKKKVYVIGSSGITDELDQAGIEHLPIGPDLLSGNWQAYVETLTLDPEVGAVVVGFDEHISYPKLIKAASYLKNPDCLLIAANKDEQYPTKADSWLTIPGTGVFVAAVETVSGRDATVLGKPSKFMFDCIQKRFPQMVPERCLMIGDRLNTDILLGTKNGLKTLLVLTGVSSIDEVRIYENSTDKDEQLLVPDFFLHSLGDLGKMLN